MKEKNNNDGNWRAAKVLSKNKIKEQSYLLNEVNVLKSLDHPNIVKIYEIFEDNIDIAIIQEYSFPKKVCVLVENCLRSCAMMINLAREMPEWCLDR